ncbi:MAG: T9SS type A sorting domain-containing protein [Chitinophagaceae bacterium]|nr:T9SS type A sorting domain-containing protein [Chitinophagaceae bacterium]
MKNILLQLTVTIALSVAISFGINAQPVLDNTFSGDGYLLTNSGGDDFARSVVIQSNGRILTGGNSFGNYGYSDISITRTKANGSPDNTFGTAGVTRIIGGFFCDMALTSSGKIIVAGSGVGPTNVNNFIVYRLTKNGVIDNTFGNNGSAKVNMPGKNMICYDVLIQPDGKILLAGYADDGSGGHHNMIIARLKANGSLDNSFATAGIFKFLPSNKSSECNQLALQPDGKIIACGHIDTLIVFSFFRYDIGALRLNINGTLDNTFGTGGVVRADKGSSDIASSVSVLTDGRIILGGSSNYLVNNRFTALCLLPDGSFDTSFGTGGWSFSDIYGSNAGCSAMVTEPDDDIIMAGLAYIYAGASNQAIVLVKLLSNGSPDASFGDNGIDTSFYGTFTQGCSDIALQTDNKIVIAGYRYVGMDGYFLTARYTNSVALAKQSAIPVDPDSQFNIYPNPNNGEFVVEVSNLLFDNTSITITNLMGQVVYENKLSSVENQMKQPVSLSVAVEDGIYFVTIRNGEKVITKRMLIQ